LPSLFFSCEFRSSSPPSPPFPIVYALLSQPPTPSLFSPFGPPGFSGGGGLIFLPAPVCRRRLGPGPPVLPRRRETTARIFCPKLLKKGSLQKERFFSTPSLILSGFHPSAILVFSLIDRLAGGEPPFLMFRRTLLFWGGGLAPFFCLAAPPFSHWCHPTPPQSLFPRPRPRTGDTQGSMPP